MPEALAPLFSSGSVTVPPSSFSPLLTGRRRRGTARGCCQPAASETDTYLIWGSQRQTPTGRGPTQSEGEIECGCKVIELPMGLGNHVWRWPEARRGETLRAESMMGSEWRQQRPARASPSTKGTSWPRAGPSTGNGASKQLQCRVWGVTGTAGSRGCQRTRVGRVGRGQKLRTHGSGFASGEACWTGVHRVSALR